MLNPVHLHTLSTVLRVGSFADAARQLGYTGSAVSQQMSLLERQLRIPLFEREAHGVRPTPIAMMIAERSTATLGALHALKDDIDLLVGGVTGRLRIGSFPTASEHLLPAALSDLRRSRPGLDVHLDEGEPAEIMERLESRELDVALVYRYNLVPQRWPKSLRTRSVLTEELLLIEAAPRTSSPGPCEARLEELVDQTWIATCDGTAGATTLQHLWRSRGMDVDVAYRSNNYGVIQGLVRKGLGVALVPAVAISSLDGLRARCLEGIEVHREVLLVWAPSTLPGLVEVFAESVRTAAHALVHSDDRPGITLS